MSAPRELIEQGNEAIRRGDSEAARLAFGSVSPDAARAGEVHEGLARAAYLDHDFKASVAHLERAYAAHRAAGEASSAVRVARKLAYVHGAILGDPAVMQGWNARALTLLAGSDDEAERGWIALTSGMFEPDRKSKDMRFLEALECARRASDTNLEFVTLAYYGASLVHADLVEEGMLRLDEACAAVAGQEVDDFFLLEEIFCQLFSACEHAHDIARADQWIRIGTEIAERRKLPSVAAFCHTHYGGLLTAAGRWDEADAALTEAVRVWGLGYSALRAGALTRLADLRVRQGRFAEAEQLLEGLDLDLEAARPLAALHLATGNAGLAADVIERALAQIDPSGAAAAPLLAILVEVELARERVDAAAEAVQRLADIAHRHPSPYLRATASLARGRLCMAAGHDEARACLEAALSGFAKSQTPMELARVRLELASAMAHDRPEAALAQAKAALDGFERLRAARQADAAAALLRTLGGPARTGPKGVGLLTKRELEVLGLIGQGLSNPEISDRLYISRKTVEHHVGNILSKLGLRSRAEAAAHAARTEKPGPR